MDVNRLLSDYINNGNKYQVIDDMLKDIIIEGFWNKQNVPKSGEYKNKLVIQKLNDINNFVHKNWQEFHDYHIVQGTYCVPVLNIDQIQYCGYAHCRLCDNVDNGDSDIIITHAGGTLIFPEGYVHYLEEHGLVPSKRFEEIILGIDVESATVPKFDYNTIMQINMLKIHKSMAGMKCSC